MAQRLFYIDQPVVGTPEVKWQMLAQVADNDFERGKTVKKAIRDDAKQMQRDCVCKAKRRADSVFTLSIQFPEALADRSSSSFSRQA